MNFEINCTLKCNQRCANCNRCPELFEKEDTDITPQQIDKFIEDIKNFKVNKIKLLGGEPLMSKHFRYVYDTLKKALDNKQFNMLKLDYNHTISLPKDLDTKGVRLMGKSLNNKRHLPVYWDPGDLGYQILPRPNCEMIRKCGQSYDYKGYLPCSAAIAIVRIFHLEHLYMDKPQRKPWGLDKLCKHCIFGMPDEWRKAHLFGVKNCLPEHRTKTKTFMKALDALEKYSYSMCEWGNSVTGVK
uniref:Putative iron-sulfur binding domain containing protein n=1 Tax=viral metagenome TaxID=1070528 RepID=A0A6M3JZE6_9ZZZZ